MTMNLALTIPCAVRAHGLEPVFDLGHGRILVDDGPAFDRRARQAKAIIQRMQMSRIAFAQRAMINGGAQPLFQLGFGEQAAVPYTPSASYSSRQALSSSI